MVSNTSFIEDIGKFIADVKSSSLEDLVISFVIILIVGAFMKNRNNGGGSNDGRGIFKMMGL